MIDERRGRGSKSKKVDGGGELDQKSKKIFSQIKTQTFTKLRSAFIFSIKKAQKLISKGSICCAILTRLTALSNLFLPKIRSILSSQNSWGRLRKAASGYVLILVLVTLPVLLWGAKYVLDIQTFHKAQLENGESESGGIVYENVAAAGTAALSVAKNWNPGLTLTQQKDAVYKVADAIYNNAGTARRLSLINQAVPGLDERHWKKSDRKLGVFDPLEIEQTDVISINPGISESIQAINYETKTRYDNRYGFYNYSSGATWNPHYAMWRAIDVNTNPSYRKSIFDELNKTALQNERYELDHHEIFKLPVIRSVGCTCTTSNGVYYPNNSRFSIAEGSNVYAQFIVTTPNTANNYSTYSGAVSYSPSTTSSINPATSTYTSRVASDRVKISIDTDKTTGGAIKVQTDDDIAFAKPAECNVDIVLAIPVNGAASNANNRDEASDTAESPVNLISATTSIPDSISGTPIYQMGQACKKFVKDHFYHTRGVTMGLIPYSAKVSLSPDKVSYTTAITPFNSNTTPEYQQKMIGSCLYSTSGVRGANLTQGYKTTSLITNQTLPTTDTCYYWGGMLTGCPIMCRRGILDGYTDYSGNYSARGLLLDTTDAKSATDNQYKFMRMNLNPCYMGYANLLSMQCEKQCTHFLPNPYYMIEPTADMVKIYEMCNALYPIYDKQNVSNFIFIPLEWTLNFWQSWTDDPGKEKVSGKVDTSTLSVPSKMGEGRKKALVLIVNKPDWFEPGELTYLGFDNDASEIPMAESDKIDFSIDYSDTTKQFLDGTNYNTEYTSGEFKGIKNKNSDDTPLVAGPKKIIKYEKISGNMARDPDTWFFDDVEGTSVIRLKIPRPAQVKITVDSVGHGISKNWKYYPQALNKEGDSVSQWTISATGRGFLLAYGNGVFSILSTYGYSAYSTDGVTWHRGSKISYWSYWNAMAFDGQYFVAMERNGSGYIAYSSNGSDWYTYDPPGLSGCSDDDFTWDADRGRFYVTMDGGASYVSTTRGGTGSWSSIGSYSPSIQDGQQLKWGGGYYVCFAINKSDMRYSSNGQSWNSHTLPLSTGRALNYGPGYWLILTQYGDLMKSTDASATSWSIIDGNSSNTTSSSLYKISGKTDWVGICYGDGKWVAYTYAGDVAVTKARTTTNSMTSTIQSASLPSTSAYTITNQTTLTVDPSKITETDEEGNYIIDFTCTNLELISAEVTNCIIDTVNPKSVTYNEGDFDGSNGVLSWSTRSEAEAARTINLTNSAPTSSDGYCVEMTDSTGKLKIASDQLKYVNGYGWVPKHANQDVLLKITSNHGGALTLNVGKWDNGTVTFYSDNITDSNNSTYDVRKDSTSGDPITLGIAQTVTGTQEFVFSGGTMPEEKTSVHSSPYLSSTQGANFCHNLSVKKVKYSLSSAVISNVVLKKQILRLYSGYYGYQNSGYKALLINDGTNASRSSDYCYGANSTFSMTSDMNISVGDSYDQNFSKFQDSCVSSASSYNYYSERGGKFRVGTSYSPREVVYKGVSPNFIVSYSHDINSVCCSYYGSSGYTDIIKVTSGFQGWSSQYTCSQSSGYSSSAIKLKFYSTVDSSGQTMQCYIQNQNDKTLQNTEATAITTNPIEYQDLIENKGVYLANYNGEKWICFQGDGELHVTVQSRSSEGMDGLYYVKYNTTQTNITSDSQDYSASWYSGGNDSYDSYCNRNEPLYHTYILLHNVYLKSVTQAAGTSYVRTLRSTRNQDIKLVVGPSSTGFTSDWKGYTSCSYTRQGIAYGDGMFVQVNSCSNHRIIYSIGSNSSSCISLSYDLKCIAFDEEDGYFYAATSAGYIYRAKRSGSGMTTWEAYKTEGCPISGINRIACGNGHIVVQNTSAQSATLDKQSLTWSGVVSQPATCYALCFGAGKFICMSYSTSSKIYSSPDGSSWTQIGSTSFRSYNAYNVCYGNGRFLATDRYGYDINISTNGGSTWYRAYSFTYTYTLKDICYGFNGFLGMYDYGTSTTSTNCYLRQFYPRLSGSEYKSNRWQVTIGSRSPQQITSRTVFTISASELTWDGSYYYVDVDIDAGYRRLRWATHDYNKSATVYDLIDFNSGERNGKNGILQATGSYSSDNGFCVANGAPNVSSSHRGRFDLRYSYSLGNNSTGMSTSTIQKTSMTHSGGRYYYNWNWSTDYVLLNVRFYHEPEMLYPYGFGNSLNLDWRDNSLEIPSGLSVSSYSKYDTGLGYHLLDTDSCSPTMYRKYATTHPYTSDVSAVLEAGAPLLANITMPEYTRTSSYLNGVTRLFSQQKRDSARTYSQLQPNSTAYNNTANLISTNFTVSQNRVLTANGYQSSGETPTKAVSDVTAAACTKLKNTYGNNLRIYVIKYKAQEKYNSFPYADKASTATAHDYATVNNCASSSSYLYSASTPEELNNVLDTIATDIKSSSFGNWQKAQNVE